MAEISQNIKYVRLDDGVSFSLVRTNPKLTTNTKLMYNGKTMYMESYSSDPLLNRMEYKHVSVKQNSTYNKDIAKFLSGSGPQAYKVYQNLSDMVISSSFDNQFETMYWCGAEYIESSFYTEEIGFVAPLYLREKLPNYFLIFRLDTPSNYNFNVDEKGKYIDSTFDFKKDILNKAVLIKTFDLREGSVLGDYIHNYIDQDLFEFDKSMYVNFSNAEVTYYGINRSDGILEKKVESFKSELLDSDNAVLKNDKWFTDGFERNNLIFPYIINIEYLFDDDLFKTKDGELYDFARYIGVYCNNIEFGEFSDLNELKESGFTQEDVIYYFEDNKNILHRYSVENISESSESEVKIEFKIDGKDADLFDTQLISGFENERVTGYAEPLDINDGFINRAQYGFEIMKPWEPGDWVGIEYDGHVECYFADNKNNVGNPNDGWEKYDMLIGEYRDFRFSVSENSTINDIAEALANSINHNKKSKFEARCTDNVVVIYAKQEGKKYNGTEGGAKILMETSLLYNKKISLPISKYITHISGNIRPIEHISDSDSVIPAYNIFTNNVEKSLFGNYYMDYFCGACDVDINHTLDIYKNVFKIYSEDYIIFDIDRYLKTKNGSGRRICANMVYINGEGKIDPSYRIILVDDAPKGKNTTEYDISVSSTYQVEILDKFKPNHGVLSWFPIKDFDFDINYSTYGQYSAFAEECEKLNKKIIYDSIDSKSSTTSANSIIKELAKSPLFDENGNYFETEYEYYLEPFIEELCVMSKSAPYIAKWGYYDEQKDSCENPYRLNVNKVFGTSNLSANTYLRTCDVNEYTHGMPYYMVFDDPDYYKEYQYIPKGDIGMDNKNNQYLMNYSNFDDGFDGYFEYVNYWLDIFKDTDTDMFSYFFSGKKYGKRFDRKYSRLLGGDKFHNPSTLFRGVKFEAVRQYNGVEKRSTEYNNYKFSFVYIPVFEDSLLFDSTVYFVKNDTFKFIVGIVFVNTMLGTFEHNIFNGDINYFGKGFLYAATKDIIRPHFYDTVYSLSVDGENIIFENVNSSFWGEHYDIKGYENKFYIYEDKNDNRFFILNMKNSIIGEFQGVEDSDSGNDIDNIINVAKPKEKYSLINYDNNKEKINIKWDIYYEENDVTIYRNRTLDYRCSVTCDKTTSYIKLKNVRLVDICDFKTEYIDESFYKVSVSELFLKSESLQNILKNIGTTDSIVEIKFHNSEKNINMEFINDSSDKNKNPIKVNIENKTINITTTESTTIQSEYDSIENLKVDITIKNNLDKNFNSLAFKDYFSVFEQLSAYNITNYINNGYNVKYFSTIEDNEFKMRVIEPDSIEIEDKHELKAVKIMQNNKNTIGSVSIQKKDDIYKIGKKVINRYSGFYNPIFNDILYYGDYSYVKSVGKLDGVKIEIPYSNTNIDYKYSDRYGDFGIIKNMYYHKTNLTRSDKILTFGQPLYPAINEYALDYRDYNIFSSSWDEGYFILQNDLYNSSYCEGIGSMKEGLCMFGSKYINLPDTIFIDTFENGKLWDENIQINVRDNTNTEIVYKEINNKTVIYHLFIEKRLKRYLKDCLFEVFSKYINKDYSFGIKGTIDDDIDEYIEKNLLSQYRVEKVNMYIKDEVMRINNKKIENDYLKYVNKSNDVKILQNFSVTNAADGIELKNSNFSMKKINEFDRTITYNLKTGVKESFGFGVSFKRK